jgi:hypothetical protein
MAKLPALVSALTECDERDYATLDYIARAIREAGLIPTTKRGSGASEMTVREAANLLIAANASETPKAGAMAVAHYRSLKGQDLSPGEYDEIEPGRFRRREHDKDGIFGRITEAANFGEALEILIDGAPELLLSLLAFMDDAYSNYDVEGRKKLKALMLTAQQFAGVEVVFNRPYPSAFVRIWSNVSGKARTHYEWRFLVDADLMMEGFYPNRHKDRSITVTVGLRTLLKLFAAVNGDDESLNSDGACSTTEGNDPPQ